MPNVNKWTDLMNQGRWELDDVQAPVGPLISGQHRLSTLVRRNAHEFIVSFFTEERRRQRRIIRVTTLKYRARRRR